MYNRPDYRIRGQRKTQEDFDDQFEQELKLSNHLKSQKRQNSAAGLKKPHELSQNSRIIDTRTNSGLGSMVGSRVGRVLRMSKIEKNTVTDIQFNNVRWISIVSAYDSKRLRHVTVSKQSCEAFLKKYGNGVKKDPAAIAYFKDIKRHFHSWLAKINEAYSVVLGQFLTVSQKPPLLSLQQIGPTLQQIRADTAMMRQKLEGCLKIYQNSDFRKLSDKFQQFFSFSRGLEQVIGIIFQSKEKIDQLFLELQQINNMDRKVQKIRKKGIKQAKKLIYNEGEYNSSLCERIMQKVIISINDMATKSLDVFGHIQGARHLLSRLKQLLNESQRKGLTISQIQKLSQIFKEIMEQANAFQKFAEHFGESGQLISAELKQKIKQYQQDLEDQKQAVSEIQILFVGNVIKETIDILKRNFSINDTLAQSKIQYQEYNHLLEEISEAMLDQTRKAAVQGLIKFEKTAFSRLDQNFDKIRRALRRNSDGLTIDSEEGLITVDCYVKQTKDYKDKVRNLIKRNQEALRNLDVNTKEVRLPSNDKDVEITFLIKLSGIVELVNGRERKHKLGTQKGFQQVNGNIANISEEAEKAYYLIQQLEQSKIQIKQMNDKNPLPNLIKFIYLDNSIYLESTYLISVYETCCNTTENNLIQQLSSLNKLFYQRKQQLEKQSHYHITKYYQNLLDRMYCFILLKGLKKTAIKELDNSNNIVFPTNQYQTKQMQNQIKYRGLIGDNLGEGCILAKKKIKQSIKVMKDFVGAYRVIQKLVTNEQGQFFIQVKQIADFNSKMFHHSILSEYEERVTQCRKVCLDLVKSLKNKLNNIELLDREIDIETHDAALKVRKQILHYQALNEKALKIAEELTKSYNSDSLEMFSSFVYSLSEYIMESKQISYLALNQFKQPIWIGLPEQSEQGLIAQVNLKGYNRGNYIQSYVRQAPSIKSIDQKIKTEVTKQPKKIESEKGSPNIKIKVQAHPQQDMDEEILVQSDKQQELIEMGDEVQEEQPQDMIEEIDDKIDEGIADQMIEDFEEDNDNVQQQKMSEDIQDIEDSKQKNKNISQKLQKQEDKKANKQKQSIKAQKQKQKKYTKSIYEVIPHFKDLNQIRNLFSLINSVEFKFWQNQVDFEEVSDYFHRQKQSKGRTNFIKSLENSFNLYLNQIFGNIQSEQMKKLQIFTVLKNNFSQLGDKNWSILFKVLQLLELNYSLLYNIQNKNEVLQIFIGNKNESSFKKQGHKKCITNYLQRTFKSIYYLPALFDIESYINYCFSVETQQLTNANGLSFHYIIKFTNKYVQALPTVNTHQQLKNIEQIQTQFIDNFLTGIDAYHFCLQMWLKTVDSFCSHYLPDFSVLKNYINKLNQIDKKEWIGHYLTEFAKQTNSVCDKIKNCHNTLVKILFKSDSSNIYKCIAQTAAIFKQTINRQVYLVGQNQKEQLIFFSTSEKVNAKYEQSQLSTIIQRCLWRKQVKEAKIVLKLSDIIPYVQGLLSEGMANAKSMSQISSFLNILQIEHFFILEPQLLISDKLQNLIHRILSHLKIKNTEDLMYNQILSDCFSISKQNYCNEVKLNKNINQEMFSQKYISKLFKQIATIDDELKKSSQQFEKTITKSNFSTLFFNKLTQIQQQQSIQIELKTRLQWLTTKYQHISIQLLNKTLNPLLYIRSQRLKIQSLNTICDQQLKQIKMMQLPFKDSNKHKQIQSYSKKLQQIKVWLQKKGLATVFTCYYVSFDQKNELIGFDLNNKSKDKSIGKQFLFQIAGKYWLSRSTMPQKEKQKILEFLYTHFIEKHIIINQKEFQVQVIFHFKLISRLLQSSIRLDLAQAEDIISFSKNYNIHRFASNHENPVILQKLVQFHSNIMKRLLLKRNLLKMKQLVIDCQWNGLETLQIPKQLLKCIKQEIDINKQEIDELITITQSIKLKQTDVAEFTQWYKRIAVKKMGFNYYQIISSEDQLITILPIIKIEKEKSKNTNEIHSMLSDIRLPHKYHVQLKDGISILNLDNEIITCKIVDQQNYLIQNKQLSSFQPDVPQNQIFLLAYYQVSDRQDSIPLYIGDLQLQTDCNLTINENNTVVEIYCAVWKIGKDDYQNYKKRYERDTKQSLVLLKKKIRGAASMIQKIKDVSIGQTLNFVEIGTWLREQLKKHHYKIQQQKRKQQERKKQQEMLIKQAEDFYKQIHEALKKQQNLPIMHLSFQDLKKIHNDKQKLDGQLTSYWKKVMKRIKKIIEKIQQTKSTEKMSRLSNISKDYLINIQKKFIKVSSLERTIVDKARQKFEVKKVQKEKKAEEIKRKNLQFIGLKEAEEKKLQKQKATNNIQSVPANSNTLNIPVESAKSNDIPIRSQEQELPDMRQVSKIQEIGKKQEKNKSTEELGTKIVDLLIENKQLNQLSKNQEQYEAYLLQLLQNQQLEDIDFYSFILEAFWSMPVQIRQEIVLLH